jgi:hypothetical protein
MKKIILLLLLCCSMFAFAQEKASVSLTKYGADQESYCLTNDADLFMFFYNNIKYPAEAAAKKVEGTILLSVDVMNDSTIRNVKTFSNIGYTIEDQAKELAHKLKYAPSIQNGYQVKSNLMMSIPVRAH